MDPKPNMTRRVLSCAEVAGQVTSDDGTLPVPVYCTAALGRLFDLPVAVCHCCGNRIRLDDTEDGGGRGE